MPQELAGAQESATTLCSQPKVSDKQYAACTAQQLDLAACILVSGFIQEAVKPHVTGISVSEALSQKHCMSICTKNVWQMTSFVRCALACHDSHRLQVCIDIANQT